MTGARELKKDWNIFWLYRGRWARSTADSHHHSSLAIHAVIIECEESQTARHKRSKLLLGSGDSSSFRSWKKMQNSGSQFVSISRHSIAEFMPRVNFPIEVSRYPSHLPENLSILRNAKISETESLEDLFLHAPPGSFHHNIDRNHKKVLLTLH